MLIGEFENCQGDVKLDTESNINNTFLSVLSDKSKPSITKLTA